jgi:hypothetical protein
VAGLESSKGHAKPLERWPLNYDDLDRQPWEKLMECLITLRKIHLQPCVSLQGKPGNNFCEKRFPQPAKQITISSLPQIKTANVLSLKSLTTPKAGFRVVVFQHLDEINHVLISPPFRMVANCVSIRRLAGSSADSRRPSHQETLYLCGL